MMETGDKTLQTTTLLKNWLGTKNGGRKGEGDARYTTPTIIIIYKHVRLS